MNTVHRTLTARIRKMTNESAALFRAGQVLDIQGEGPRADVLFAASAAIDAELEGLFAQVEALEFKASMDATREAA